LIYKIPPTPPLPAGRQALPKVPPFAGFVKEGQGEIFTNLSHEVV